MRNPVTASDGHTYERGAIKKWMEEHNNSSPFTRNPITSINPNITIKNLCREYISSDVSLLKKAIMEAKERVKKEEEKIKEIEEEKEKLKKSRVRRRNYKKKLKEYIKELYKVSVSKGGLKYKKGALGQGKMIYPDGDVYEGEWKDGLEHGQFKLTYANGDIAIFTHDEID